jgi:hypothetical protein
MPTQLKVSVTKDIIARCKNCGGENTEDIIGKNCAIAFALVDIFPNIYVSGYYILPFGIDSEKDIKISLPPIAQQFIKLFDGFSLTPKLRLMLPEFEFTIDIPDEVIDEINIDEVRVLAEDGKKTQLIASAERLLA